MKIKLNEVKIEDLKLSEKSKELLAHVVSDFKNIKVVKSLRIAHLWFEIETDPAEMESLTSFKPHIGYGLNDLDKCEFEDPILPMDGFFELIITLLVDARDDDGSIDCAHLEKRLLLPKL